MPYLTMQQIGKYAYKAGFTSKAKLTTAIAVAWAESGGRTEVVNYLGCTGLFQIYVKVHIKNHPSWTTKAMKQPYNNCKAAYELSNGGSNWKPWEAYTLGMHKKYMGPAARAAAKVISQAGGDGSKTSPGSSGAQLSKVLALAASQVGYREVGRNRTKYWAALAPGLQGQPWCGAFTHWVLKKNGIDIKALGCSNPYYTPTIQSWAKKTGRFTRTPKPGYLVLFSWNGKRVQHVGIVEKVLSKGVQTIEGNTSSSSSGSQNNGGGVWRKRRTSNIVGYVRIDYDPSRAGGDRSVDDPDRPEMPKLDHAKVPENGKFDKATQDILAIVSNMPKPANMQAYWRWIEAWCGLEGKWVDGDLDYVTIQAIQWRTNQSVIDGKWNSRTILGIQKYLNSQNI